MVTREPFLAAFDLVREDSLVLSPLGAAFFSGRDPSIVSPCRNSIFFRGDLAPVPPSKAAFDLAAFFLAFLTLALGWRRSIQASAFCS